MNNLKWVRYFLFSLFVVCVVGLTSAQAFEECIQYFNQVESPIKQRKSLAESRVLVLENHRQIAYHTFNLQDLEKPVLLIFPGIFSSLDQISDFILELEARNIPYVNFSFSSHPSSIAKLNPNADLPDFKDLSVVDLAEEVVALVQHLGIKKPLALPTSYSSILIEHLPTDIFPLVIDTTPMGHLYEEHTMFSYMSNMVSVASSFNPFSQSMNGLIKRRSYYNYWKLEVNLKSIIYPELRGSKLNALATEGYVAMVIAAEGYDFRSVDFNKGPKRVFVLAGKEISERLDYQRQAIAKLEEQLGYKPLVHIIEESTHIVAYSKPQEYINIILDIFASY